MNAIFVPGFPVLLRSRWGLQPLQIQPLTASEITRMLGEILPVNRTGEVADVHMFDVQHDADSRFRVLVCGGDTSRPVILTKIPPQTRPLSTASDWERQPPIEAVLSLDRILTTCAEQLRCDAILVPGCPPLAWSQQDIRGLAAEALTRDEIESMVAEKMPPANLTRRDNGFLNFGVLFNEVKFNVAVFGDSLPSLVVMMNISVDKLQAV